MNLYCALSNDEITISCGHDELASYPVTVDGAFRFAIFMRSVLKIPCYLSSTIDWPEDYGHTTDEMAMFFPERFAVGE